MNQHKKITILVCIFLMTLSIVACGKAKEDEFVPSQQESDIRTNESAESDLKRDEIVNTENSLENQKENNAQVIENTDSETQEDETVNAKESSVNQQENSTQTTENADSEATAEELLDMFINGTISAISSEDSASTFYIIDLDMDSGEWDSYSIGEKVDLDNDGENELIIYGPYGGIYLDARDNKVYEFAVGEGDALVLSYVVYNGSTWIMHSNRMNTGYEAYHMEKFEGADNLVAEMNFYEELVDEDNVEGKEKYTLNGTEISYDEYFELCSKIFATEVSTN